MKNYQKRPIILLPTDKQSFGEYLVFNKNKELCVWDTNKMGSQKSLPVHHIYVLSGDKIKKGDWISYPTLKNWVPVQYLGGDLTGNERKIIATTDRSLIYNRKQMESNDLLDTQAFYRILPQPSQSFLEKYVEEYNKGNVITDVLVEYEKKQVERLHDMYSINHERNQQLKVNPKDNTITIKEIKDSWSREEHEKALRSLYQAVSNKHRFGDGIFNIDEWIDAQS